MNVAEHFSIDMAPRFDPPVVGGENLGDRDGLLGHERHHHTAGIT